jgi:peptidoglycan hydrolase-like protein with peptidoglycan-binding domain
VTITMYDSAYNGQFPADPRAVAGYVDGGVGDQPNFGWLVQAFPSAHHLSIALFPDKDADALDVETGAARPGDIPGWYARQRRRGIDRPCAYANASTMEEFVVPVIRAAPILRSAVRLWSAHYTEEPHICGPKSCGATSIDMDGTQWTSKALGRTLDQSRLLDDFFGTPVPSPSTAYAEVDMAKLPVLKQGDSDKPGQFWPVRRLQALVALTGKINGIPAAQVSADGVFGKATDAGVRAVQAHYGITADGIAGAQTWSVLLTGSAS